MSILLLLMRTSFTGCVLMLPGSSNVMKGTNPLSHQVFAFFNISLPQVVELIKTRKTDDEKTVSAPSSEPSKQAILAQKALASGSQAPPAPVALPITSLPESFALDPPVPSQLSQPASARAQAPFFWLGAAWVKSEAERPSVSEVN